MGYSMKHRERRQALAELLDHMANKIDDGRNKIDGHASEIRTMSERIRNGQSAHDNTRYLSDLGCYLMSAIDRVLKAS
jgi:hypothetical protein